MVIIDKQARWRFSSVARGLISSMTSSLSVSTIRKQTAFCTLLKLDHWSDRHCFIFPEFESGLKVTRPLDGDMIVLSFAVTAMYALLGVPPPVPFLPVRRTETDSPQCTSDNNVDSHRDSSQDRKPGKKQTKSRLSITKKDKSSPGRKNLPYPSPTSTPMGSKSRNQMEKRMELNGSLKSRQSSPQMSTSKFRRREDVLDHGDKAKTAAETPRKNTKELANNSSSSVGGRCLHSSTGTTALIKSSALERSRLAYEKKIQQLSSRFNNSAAAKKDWTPVRPRRSVSNATPKTESLRTPGGLRTSFDGSQKTGVTSDSHEEFSGLASKLNPFTRLLGRSFSASSALPPMVSKQSVTSSPETPINKPAQKQWRSTGVIRSHSVGDTPTTPLTHRDKYRQQMQLEEKKPVRSPVKVAGRKDISKTSLPVKENPQVSQATVGSTCFHICIYYALSFLVFVCIQMYEAYFGGNLFQLLANSRRYC